MLNMANGENCGGAAPTAELFRIYDSDGNLIEYKNAPNSQKNYGRITVNEKYSARVAGLGNVNYSVIGTLQSIGDFLDGVITGNGYFILPDGSKLKADTPSVTPTGYATMLKPDGTRVRGTLDISKQTCELTFTDSEGEHGLGVVITSPIHKIPMLRLGFRLL